MLRDHSKGSTRPPIAAVPSGPVELQDVHLGRIGGGDVHRKGSTVFAAVSAVVRTANHYPVGEAGVVSSDVEGALVGLFGSGMSSSNVPLDL